MNWPRKFVFATLSLMLLFTVGCGLFPKKKTTARVTLQTLPPEYTQPSPIPPPMPDQIPAAELPSLPVAKEEPKPVPPPPPRKRHPSTAKKTTPAPPAASPVQSQSNAPAQSNAPTQSNAPAATTTVAVSRPPEEPPTNAAIATEVAPAQKEVDKQSTEKMLDEAQKTVNALDDHSLSGDQKAIKEQIQSYIDQSRKASKDGDLERALNLAKKAQLLSQALVNK